MLHFLGVDLADADAMTIRAAKFLISDLFLASVFLSFRFFIGINPIRKGEEKLSLNFRLKTL
jgi:hypothetical protein